MKEKNNTILYVIYFIVLAFIICRVIITEGELKSYDYILAALLIIPTFRRFMIKRNQSQA